MSGTDYVLTPNLGLFQPVTGADSDQWGTHWNENASILDTIVGGLTTSGAAPSNAAPLMDGTAAAGTSALYAREGHVHPTDTSRAASSHTHTAANITDFAEATDDRVAALLKQGANVTLTYDDVANTLTVAASGGGSGIAEAPLDTFPYGRQDGAWSRVWPVYQPLSLATSPGTAVSITAGNTTSGAGTGGSLTLAAGNGVTAGGSIGGDVFVNGGRGLSGSGSVTVQSIGTSMTGGASGAITIRTATPAGGASSSGAVNISTGNASGAGSPGAINLTPGNGTFTGVSGGSVNLNPGAGGGTAGAGGDLKITFAAKTSTGRQGLVIVNALPTVDPAVTNALWSSNGTVVLSGSTAGGAYLPLAGGTLTGPLLLAADGTLPLHAATVQQLNAKAGAYLPLTGGALSGPLTVNAAGVQIKAPSDPRLSFFATGAAADSKIVDAYVGPTGNFTLQFVNDAFNAGTPILTAARSGNAVESLSLYAPSITLNGGVTVANALSVNGTIYPSAAATNFAYSLFASGSYRYIKFTIDSWLLRFDAATGNLDYFNPGGYSLFQVSGAGHVWTNGNVAIASGIQYRQFSTNYIGFGWGASSDLNAYVDTTHVGRIALHGQDVTFAALTGAYVLSTGNGSATGWFQANAIYGGGGVYAGWNGDNDFGLYRPGASNRVLQFASGWYWQWLTADGQTSWTAFDHELWRMRVSPDNLVWNPNGPVGGNGAYMNISDRRMKENIGPASVGLSEVLRLKPVRFNRRRVGAEEQKRPDGSTFRMAAPPPELGFLADEVRDILPHAVRVVGSPTPDGEGGLDSDDPTLALTYDSITVALVAAVQEMHADLQAMKKGRRA